jgi:hypothetical protein
VSGFSRTLLRQSNWNSPRAHRVGFLNDAMIGFHGAEPSAVAAAYDCSECETVVDVGGGTGNLVAAILERHPRPRGILADLPHVVREASVLVKAARSCGSCHDRTDRFLPECSRGRDAYLLSHVIHDLNEDQCLTILDDCRHAMKPNSRLLIIERVLPAGDTRHQGKLLDLAMLVMPGGQERTEEEYGTLLSKAGKPINAARVRGRRATA